MLKDYSRYILNIRNSLIQRGVSFSDISVDEDDYFAIFKCALELDDVLEVFRGLVFSGVVEGIFVPLNDIYALYIRDQALSEFQESILPMLREQFGDKEELVKLEELIGYEDSDEVWENTEDDSLNADGISGLFEDDLIDLFEDSDEETISESLVVESDDSESTSSELSIKPDTSSVSVDTGAKIEQRFQSSGQIDLGVYHPQPKKDVQYVAHGKSILDCVILDKSHNEDESFSWDEPEEPEVWNDENSEEFDEDSSEESEDWEEPDEIIIHDWNDEDESGEFEDSEDSEGWEEPVEDVDHLWSDDDESDEDDDAEASGIWDEPIEDDGWDYSESEDDEDSENDSGDSFSEWEEPDGVDEHGWGDEEEDSVFDASSVSSTVKPITPVSQPKNAPDKDFIDRAGDAINSMLSGAKQKVSDWLRPKE